MRSVIAHYEVPLLVPEAREFFREAPIAGEFKESHFVAELTRHLQSGSALVLAAGSPFRGAIGGVLFNGLAIADFSCMEYFWYVNRHERGSIGVRLLAEFEQRLRDLGVRRLMMMHLSSPECDDKFLSLYDRRGYQLKERVFVKDLQ